MLSGHTIWMNQLPYPISASLSCNGSLFSEMTCPVQTMLCLTYTLNYAFMRTQVLSCNRRKCMVADALPSSQSWADIAINGLCLLHFARIYFFLYYVQHHLWEVKSYDKVHTWCEGFSIWTSFMNTFLNHGLWSGLPHILLTSTSAEDYRPPKRHRKCRQKESQERFHNTIDCITWQECARHDISHRTNRNSTHESRSLRVDDYLIYAAFAVLVINAGLQTKQTPDAYDIAKFKQDWYQ